MKTTLMKMTWWCLASPGAAPRAVGADSRENEPRRQGGMYGTLVERASTTCERVHRWLTPLKEVQAASAPRSTEVVDQPIAKRASLGDANPADDDHSKETQETQRHCERQICARESPGILQGFRGSSGRASAACLGSRGRRGRDFGTRGWTV